MSANAPAEIAAELAAVHVASCSQHLADHGAAEVLLSYNVTNAERSPPRHNTLFSRMQNVRRSASGLRHSARNVSKTLFRSPVGTALCAVMTGFILGLVAAMVVMGCTKLNDCPVQPLLPIWLVAGAAPVLIRNALSTATYELNMIEKNTLDVFTCIGLAFQFAWFVTGCVLVYELRQIMDSPSDDPTRYCDRTLVSASFLVLQFVCAAAGLALLCLLWVLGTACAKPTCPGEV